MMVSDLELNTWISYGSQGMEYYLSTEKRSYIEAMDMCEEKGSTMAKLTSQQMGTAFLTTFDYPYFMTDLNDIEEGKVYLH